MKNGKLFLILLFTGYFSCVPEDPQRFTLSTTASPTEGGKINYSPLNNSFNEGEKVTITPEPNENWIFQKWEGDASGSLSPLVLEMNSNKSIIAVFVKRVYPLNLTIIGEGTVSEVIIENPSGREFPHGTTVELTPIPNEGWVFESWSIEPARGNIISNENPKRITVDTEKTVLVRFVPKPPGDPKFYLAENGITCKCENVITGSKGIINGDQYEAVNNDFLRIRLAQKTDMSKLCTSLVTDMSYLFNGAGNFVHLIYNWDVSNVTNMEGMFGVFSEWGDTGPNPLFFNQPLEEWDVSNVDNMDYMFYENVNFNQDLSKWCVAKIPTIPMDFSNSAWTLPKPVWGTCPD